MKKAISFNQDNVFTVTGEQLCGFGLNINALQSDGTTSAVISDLTQIKVKVMLKRNDIPFIIFDGNILEFNQALNGDSEVMDANKKKTGTYYKPVLKHGSITLNGKDEYILEVYCRSTSFTSLSVAQSTIEIETVPTSVPETFVYTVETLPMEVGLEKFEKTLTGSVVGICAATDYVDQISASSKLPSNIQLDSDQFNMDISASMHDRLRFLSDRDNYDTMYNSVIYDQKNKPLTNVRLKLDYDTALPANSKLLVTRMVSI